MRWFELEYYWILFYARCADVRLRISFLRLWSSNKRYNNNSVVWSRYSSFHHHRNDSTNWEYYSHCNKFIRVVNKFIHIPRSYFLPHSRDLSSRNQLNVVKVINFLWFSSFFYYHKVYNFFIAIVKKPFLHIHQLFTPRHCLNILHIDGLWGQAGKHWRMRRQTEWKKINYNSTTFAWKLCVECCVRAVIQFGLWIMEISGESFGQIWLRWIRLRNSTQVV